VGPLEYLRFAQALKVAGYHSFFNFSQVCSPRADFICSMSSLFNHKNVAASSGIDTILPNDVQLASATDDSISDVSWSPVANHLAVASWDNKVRVFDLTQSKSGELKAGIEFDAPVFSCHWERVSLIILAELNFLTMYFHRAVDL
jgi:WD40 repeat protein